MLGDTQAADVAEEMNVSPWAVYKVSHECCSVYVENWTACSGYSKRFCRIFSCGCPIASSLCGWGRFPKHHNHERADDRDHTPLSVRGRTKIADLWKISRRNRLMGQLSIWTTVKVANRLSMNWKLSLPAHKMGTRCGSSAIESACQVAIGRLLTSSSPPKFQQEPLVENRTLVPTRFWRESGKGGMGMVYLAQHE